MTFQKGNKLGRGYKARGEKFAARGRRNRQRGQEGEREVCQILTDALGISIKRLLGQERDGGCDINLDPYRGEVKRRKKLAGVYEWLENSDVVFMRADGKEWLALVRLPDWVKLAREEIVKEQKDESRALPTA